jgi:outer membrane receptor protein involved in Fe transport
MRTIQSAAIAIVFAVSSLVAQTESDSAAAAPPDSVVRVIPIAYIGSVEPSASEVTVIRRGDIIAMEYRSLYDILARLPGVFIRDLASPGHQNQIVINGIDDRNIAVMIDGIPYNDPFTGAVNLWNVPVEEVDRIEFLPGPVSSFYDGRSAGGTINIVTRDFTNNKALTVLRYSQGIDGYAQTDAMFAQNIVRGLNLSFGLTHYGFGSNQESAFFIGRFYNGNDNAWGGRIKLRYNVSDVVNVEFVHRIANTWTGLNGGVDFGRSASIFEATSATVRNMDAYEKLDDRSSVLTLAVSPAEDSSQLLTFSGFLFDRLREYRDEENRPYANGIFEQANFASTVRGIRGRYGYSTSFNRTHVYAQYVELERNRDRRRSPLVGVKETMMPLAGVSVTGFGTMNDRDAAFGGEASVALTEALSVYAGGSSVGRTLASELPITSSPYESAERYEAGIALCGDIPVTGRVYGFLSTLQHPLFYSGMTDSLSSYIVPLTVPDTYTMKGVAGSLQFQWNAFHLDGSGTYLVQPPLYENGARLTLYPSIVADGSLYYKGSLARGHFDVITGIRGRYYSGQTGMAPFDYHGVWTVSSEIYFGRTGSVDFFMIGRLGDAYIHFIWENLTGNNYLLAPVYPVYGRNIRFGVTWEFVN